MRLEQMSRIVCLLVAVSLTSVGFSQAATLPATSSTLEAWFNADTLAGANGSSVNTWANSAVAGTISNATAGAVAPTLQTSVAAFNGNNAVSFNGTSNLAGTISALTLAGADIFIVGDLHSTTASNSGIFAMAVTGGNDYQTGGVLGWNSGDITTPGPTQGQPSGADSYFNGIGGGTTNRTGPFNQVEIYNFDANPGTNQTILSTSHSGSSVLGTQSLSSGTTSTPNLFAIGTRILSGSPSANFAIVDVAEILVYNGSLSSTDQAAVQAYLYDKYLTPEPSSLVLIGLGAIAVLAAARRKCTKG